MFGPSEGAEFRILVGFHEHGGHADRDGGAGQHRHEFALAARGGALPARLLHRMSGVVHHGVAGRRQDREGAHVGDQGVVAEAHAALAHQHVLVARARDLGDHVLHVPGRQELALFYVDGLAGLARCQQQVGLPAQKGRDLEHVHGLGGSGTLLGGVNVGQHRDVAALAHFGQDRQRPLQAQATFAAQAGAVGLVEAGLVDQANSELVRDFLDRLRHFKRVLAQFERAGPRDQGEGPIIGDVEFADFDDVHHVREVEGRGLGADNSGRRRCRKPDIVPPAAPGRAAPLTQINAATGCAGEIAANRQGAAKSASLSRLHTI